ncbi:MAG: hypothetical protein E6G28_09705 [Actinobacteria bacterium]|nr:MAG: hypothetical protein E6G28_09705 [Actinomycetota bacterium]
MSSAGRDVGTGARWPQDSRARKRWDYALKEAQLYGNGGQHVGPVAGRIVAEVLIGLLQSDPNGFLANSPSWQPTLQNPGSGFRMTDFLTYAGVDPATRHSQQPSFA